jgi:6-phosphogluconolactonase (cycloisomerase 2 family)
VPDASYASDIHVHANGKFLYVANRPVNADGSIVCFSILDGRLSLL